jgi:hypothetical protein
MVELLQQPHTTLQRPTTNNQQLQLLHILLLRRIIKLQNLLIVRLVLILVLLDRLLQLDKLKRIKHLVLLISNQILHRAQLILRDIQLLLLLLLHHQLQQIVSCSLVFWSFFFFIFFIHLSPKSFIMITNCDLGTNNMKLILSRYIKR